MAVPDSPADVAIKNPDVLTPVPGGGPGIPSQHIFLSQGPWDFNAQAQTPPPLTGTVRANHTKQNESTFLYLSCTTQAGNDATAVLQSVLRKNAKIKLQSDATPAQFKVFALTDDAILDTSFVPNFMRIPVVFDSGDQEIAHQALLTVSVEAPVLGVTFASFTRGNVVTAMAFGKFEGEDALYIATGDNVYRVDPRGFVREMVFYPVANPLLPPTPT